MRAMDPLLEDIDHLAGRGAWDAIGARFEPADPKQILRWSVARFGNGLVLGTGLGLSGIVLMHLMRELTPRPNIFFLDTGLHFEETYDLIRRLETHLDIRIESVRPALTVEEQAMQEGPALWNRDPDRCCYLRKVVPLRNHLGPYDAWVTGIRRDQGASRAHAPIASYVEAYDVVKLNPLATWTREMVWTYIQAHGLPYNRLHDEGYGSIGCAPCTAVAGPGTSERAGRWVGRAKVECGLHTV